MPSANSSPATAIEFGPLVGTTPITSAESVDHVNEYWLKYTAVEGDTAVSFFLFGATPAAIEVYEGLTAADAFSPNYLGIADSVGNRPIYVPVAPGEVYYFVIFSLSGVTRDYDLRVQRLPNLPVPVGSYVIPDSKDKLPAVFIGSDGTYLRLMQPYAHGETSQVLKNGISMSADAFTDSFNLYSAQFAFLASVTIAGFTSGHGAIGTNKNDRFYVSPANGGNIRKIYTVTQTGTISGVLATVAGAVSVSSMQPSNDETILYWASSASPNNLPIQRHNLSTNTAMANLAAGAGATMATGDIMVLDDDRIVVNYTDLTTGDALVNFYNPDGSIDLAVPITGYPVPNSGHRMALGVDDQSTVIVWMHPETNAANSDFLSIDTTTGAITVTASNVATYIDAIYMENPGVADPIADYGIPESCHFFVSRVEIPDCECEDEECPPKPEFGGSKGFSGGAEGDDPTRVMTPWTIVCAFGGEVPTGVNGTDTENWAS
jgi:hypothetical protein